MPSALRYGLGLPLAFVLTHVSSWFLGDVFTLLKFWLGHDVEFRVSARIAFHSTQLALPLYTHPASLRDLLMPMLPPFVGIAIVVLLLKNGSSGWGNRKSLIDAIILGCVIGAIFGVVYAILTTQPTGSHLVGFWNGREMPVMWGASLSAIATGGLFGTIAATLIWSLAHVKHEA